MTVRLLVIGDGVVIALFSLAGIASHHGFAMMLKEIFRVSWPFLLGYGVAAYLAGAWQMGLDGRAYFRNFVKAWGWGITLAILMRIAVESRVPIASFFGVAYGVTAVLLGLWRGIYWWIIRPRHRLEVRD